jgi:hypothetical protein
VKGILIGIAAIVATVVLIGWLIREGRRALASAAVAEAGRKAADTVLAETITRIEDGRQGAVQARVDLATGRTPDQIVRENDEAW